MPSFIEKEADKIAARKKISRKEATGQILGYLERLEKLMDARSTAATEPAHSPEAMSGKPEMAATVRHDLLLNGLQGILGHIELAISYARKIE